MYQWIDVVSIAEKHAEAQVITTRQQYLPLLKIAEQYATANQMWLGGQIGLRMILGETDLLRNDFVMDLYTTDTQTHGRALADLFQSSSKQIVKLTTKVPTDVQLNLEVNGYLLVILHLIPSHDDKINPRLQQRGGKHVPLVDVLTSFVSVSFLTGDKVVCFGPEIQLIKCYSQLIDIGSRSDWINLIETEIQLRQLFRDRFCKKCHIADPQRSQSGGGEINKFREMIVNALVVEYMGGHGRAWIGTYTCQPQSSLSVYQDKLQAITWHDFKDEEKAIRTILKALPANLEISASRHDPQCLMLPKLRRLTMYARVIGKEEPFEPVIDLFNNAHFTTVPFHRDYRFLPKPIRRLLDKNPTVQPRIGTPFVVMQMFLVDLWIAQMLQKLNIITRLRFSDVTTQSIRDCLTTGIEMDIFTQERLFEAALPTSADNYLGNFFDPSVEAKRLIRAIKTDPERPALVKPYFPKRALKFDSDDAKTTEP
jgi:hypothetical protein